MRRGGTSGAAPEAVSQAVGRGCQSGWGRLLLVTTANETGTWRQETVAGHRLGALEGGTCPPSNASLGCAWGEGGVAEKVAKNSLVKRLMQSKEAPHTYTALHTKAMDALRWRRVVWQDKPV